MIREPSPIRICLIAPKAYPLFNPQADGVVGGAEVDLYYLATELARDEEIQVSFLCADYGQAAEETWEGVRVLRTVDFKRNQLTGALQIWRGLRRADAQICMIKTISLGMFLVALFCRCYKRHFVFRSSNTGSCDGRYLQAHPIQGRIYRWALGSAAGVFVQNQSDAEQLLKTTGVKAMAVPNGHRLLPKPNSNKRDTILWMGRSVAIKRPELFLDLARALPERQFTMICQRATGDQNYDPLCQRARGIDNLEFIGSVPFTKVHTYYQRAQVLVNTSDAEGFPNAFIEACQHAVPIVSLNVNPDGFLDTQGCGICCHGDMDRLVADLDTLLAGDGHKAMGTQARCYLEQHHDVAPIAARYKAFFQDLLKDAKA